MLNKPFQHPKKIVPVLLLLCMFCSAPSYAGNTNDSDESSDPIIAKKNALLEFMKHKGKCKEEWEEKFKEERESRKAMQKELRSLNISIGAGYSGNIAGDNKIFKLNVDTGIDYGIYRRVFQLKAETNILFENGALREKVTKLNLYYNHYYQPWLGLFGYIESYSDSYLSIKHRYEAGGGFNFEMDLGMQKKAREEMSEYKENAKVFNDISDFIKKLKEDDKLRKVYGFDKKTFKKYRQQFYQEKEEQEDIINAFKKKCSLLTLGIAVIFLSDLEKAEIETPVYNQTSNGSEIIQEKVDNALFPLEAQQRYRLVVRPQVVIRPNDSVILKGMYFHKFPFSKPTKTPDGILDFRSNLLARAEYTMSKSVTWAKKVKVVFEYQFQYDNLPPQVPNAIIEKYKSDYSAVNSNTITGEIALGKTTAEKKHRLFQWKLLIEF